MRADRVARQAVSVHLGISPEWATIQQVHGAQVLVVEEPGPAGSGDALVTRRPHLPVAVFTADCLGVVFSSDEAIGVAHAGWRGLAAGVLEATVGALRDFGAPPPLAHIGAGIGPCCFEVGDDVAGEFPGDVATTTWGTTSVDLVAAARRKLDGIDVTSDDRCTACGGGFSHRADANPARMAAIGWLR